MLGLLGTRRRPMWRTRRDTVDLRWLSLRSFTQRWYPQGIDLGTFRGEPALAISWFRKDGTGLEHAASRVTMIDLERARSLDVVLAIEGDDGRLEPARFHAGGLAWFGDRLLASATDEGIWEFDLADVRRVRGAEARTLVGSSGRGIGASVLAVVRTRVHELPIRCSFVGRALDADGTPQQRVLVGEYRTTKDGRVAEVTVPADPDAPLELIDDIRPGIARMQGAVRWGDRTFVSQSRGMKGGRLWVGSPWHDDASSEHEALAPSGVPLPIGPEDLALDVEGRMLWSLGEHPWKRVVRGIPFARIGL